MKHLFLSMCLVLFLVSSSGGQPAGTIYLSADPTGFDCCIIDVSPGLVKVHMIVDLPGGHAVQFGAPKPDCWLGATYLGDVLVPNTLPIGNTHAAQGLALIVGTPGVLCPQGGATSPKYIGYISYMTTGEAPTCCEYPVIKVNDVTPEIPGPIGTICDGVGQIPLIVELKGESLMINPDPSCLCTSTLPSEDHTWGKIKSLYQ